MVRKATSLLMLLAFCAALACQSEELDPTPSPVRALPADSVDVEVFIKGFTNDQRSCIEKTVASERLPRVVRAFVANLDRGDQAQTEDELAALAFYECTPDEFTVLSIVARARRAALPVTQAPLDLDDATLPSDEDAFDALYHRMPERVNGLTKSQVGTMSLAYSDASSSGSRAIKLETLVADGDPDFDGWSAPDRLLLQVSLFQRYAELMEPGTDGGLVWVKMTLMADTAVHRFTWAEVDSTVWYLVEGDSMDDVFAVVQAFSKASR